MSLLNMRDVDGYRAFDEAECRAAGASRAAAYQNAKPFPHMVIDDFLDPDLLRQASAAYPSSEGRAFFDRDQERLKYQYSPNDVDSALVRNLLAELNGQAFLGFLEEATGIKGLVGDPYYTGGGLHETKRGGHLGVHADFNIHHIMGLERRLNLLVYLNEDWSPEFGGALELWDTEMKAREVQVYPVLGRAVVFTTALDSFHGHPDPLACPPERTRRSIATYYYTAFADSAGMTPDRTTNFQVRPGSSDKTDWAIRRTHLINDWVPPALRRIARQFR